MDLNFSISHKAGKGIHVHGMQHCMVVKSISAPVVLRPSDVTSFLSPILEDGRDEKIGEMTAELI